MSWICFHIENERLLKAAVSEEIRVECDKHFQAKGIRRKRKMDTGERSNFVLYCRRGILCCSQDNGPIW